MGASTWFETKRDQRKVREEGVAGRNLWVTKQLIEREVQQRTGRPLRYDIQLYYFSYADESFGGAPRPYKVNIGSKADPNWINMPIYSREDMNNLIGPCFGRYIHIIDRLIDTAISEAVPEMTNQSRLERTEYIQSSALEVMEPGQDGHIRVGAPPDRRSLTHDDILS
jgi:hypothetical protein